MSAPLSRRNFLRLSSLSALGLAFKPLPLDDQPEPIFWGRVIFVYLTVYSRPSVYGRTVALYDLETVLPIYEEVEGQDADAYNKKWYQTRDGFIHSTNVQPVAIRPNLPAAISDLTLGEVTVPSVVARARPGYLSTERYRLYYGSTYWIRQSRQDRDGRVWYELWDERYDNSYYVPSSTVRVIPPDEISPISPGVKDKTILIDTTAQTIAALENGQVVFKTRTSSGGVFGIDKDFRTPLGDYVIDRKRPTRHMAAGDGAADDAYDLPGVPWVSYFNGGIAIHGTYWHNDYGRPWSHGCINVLPQDAKWLYRWVLPVAPAGQPLVEARGTSVVVV
ncbi:MAG: L,D-transpeptidase [Chloroflexi bacterium]|nr:L,D-transpeptidase [Chloroflexota bacterium]